MNFTLKKQILILLSLLFFGFIPPLGAETLINDDINENTTWTTRGNPYRINQSISVTNEDQPVTLTIEAGVEVIFKDLRGVADNRIDFRNNSALVIQGTESAPVLFTSEEGDKTITDVYGGLRFHESAKASESVINHAIFEQARQAVIIYTGVPTISNSTFRYCNNGVYMETTDTSQTPLNPVITNSKFLHNAEYGIFIDNANAQISSCRFENNGTWWDWNGKWVPYEGAAVSIRNSDPLFIGNTAPAYDMTAGHNQFIEIRNDFDISAAWEIPGTLDGGGIFPYYIKDSFSFENDTQPITLTIPAGVKVMFNDLRGVAHCRIDIRKNAALTIQGTEGNPVLFTNVEPDKTQTGAWSGIRFLSDSKSSESVISHAIFEQANEAIEIYNGSPTIQNTIFRYGNTGIWVETPDDYAGQSINPLISGCKFLHNSQFGIYFKRADGQVTACRFEENGSWRDWNGKWVPDQGGAIEIENANPVLLNNTAPAYNAVSGNNQFVLIAEDFNRNANWKIPGTLDDDGVFPYFIKRSFTVENEDQPVRLTIDPGVRMIFNDLRGVSYLRLILGSNAALTAEGTMEKPILFTGLEPDKTQKGVWTGINFTDESRPAASKISNVIIEQANEGIDITGGSLAVSSSLFQYCTRGITLYEGSNLQVSNSTFSNNLYGVWTEDPGTGVKINGCIIRENSDHGVYNDSTVCIDARNNFWGHPTGPLDDSDSHDCVYTAGYTYYNPDGQANKVTDHVIYDPWNRSETPCFCPDSDADGVPDAWDDCPGTQAGFYVNKKGCASQLQQFDISGDGKIGLQEIIHFLQVVAGEKVQK